MSSGNFLSILFLTLVISACKNDNLKVDTSDIKLKINYLNLDSLLTNSDSSQLIIVNREMRNKIPDAYDYTLGYCLQIKNSNDSTIYNTLKEYKKDPYIIRLEKRIEEKFSNLEKIEMNLNDGFRHLKYHFPKGKQPQNIIFINSLFAANASSLENDIAIGLERYLGPKTDVVKELPPQTFFEWIKEGMERKYLERDAVCSWIIAHYLEEADGNLGENIVRWGKILYLTKACFPDESDALIMRYSDADYEWAEKNEYSYWKYLITQQMLYTIDERNKSNMLNDAPFTIGLPEKGPDRLGQYLGYQMVLQFMDDNDITLEKLLKTPYNDIIQNYEVE